MHSKPRFLSKMKILLLVLAVLVAATYAEEEPETLSKEYTKKSKDAQKKCKEKFSSISEEDAEKLFNGRKMPKTQDEKCLAACYGKEIGYMNEDGTKMDLDKLKTSNNEKFKKTENREKANRVVTTCVDKVKNEQDKCEVAANFFTCYAKEAKNEDLKLPKYNPEVK